MKKKLGGVLASQSCIPYLKPNNMLYFIVLFYCLFQLWLKFNAWYSAGIYLNGRKWCSMSIIWLSEKYVLQKLDYITVCMMINNSINFWIIVIHPEPNQGVSFLNIYHEYNVIYKYEENIGGGLGKSIVWSVIWVR